MNTRLCLIMACLLLSACQSQREKFTSIWSPAEVVEDATAYSNNYDNSMLDNPLGQNHEPAISRDPNKLLTLTDVSGNREYLLLDSIAQERGILTALIEFRYVRPQTLPANGMTYHYNQWREQIDCKNKVRILRTTTHYNLGGEIVDTINYPLPKYKPAELAALSQPNDKVIMEVCERSGAVGLAVGDASVAATSDGKAVNEPAGKTKKTKADKSAKDAAKDSKTDSKKDDGKVKVEEKIDFINKDKIDNAGKPDPVTGKVVEPPKTEEKPADKASEEKGKKGKKSKKTKEKVAEKPTEKPTDKPVEKPTEAPVEKPADKPVESPAPEEGEIELKPI